MGRVVERTEISNLVRELQNSGKTVVITNGCFDILHVGHVRYLQKTKSFADKLLVCLNSDKSVRSIKGPTRPINNENDRAEILCRGWRHSGTAESILHLHPSQPSRSGSSSYTDGPHTETAAVHA